MEWLSNIRVPYHVRERLHAFDDKTMRYLYYRKKLLIIPLVFSIISVITRVILHFFYIPDINYIVEYISLFLDILYSFTMITLIGSTLNKYSITRNVFFCLIISYIYHTIYIIYPWFLTENSFNVEISYHNVF